VCVIASSIIICQSNYYYITVLNSANRKKIKPCINFIKATKSINQWLNNSKFYFYSTSACILAKVNGAPIIVVIGTPGIRGGRGGNAILVTWIALQLKR